MHSCLLLSVVQRSAKLFKEAVSKQTGIVGLFSHLTDDQVEALYASDSRALNDGTVMYIGSFVGFVLVPNGPGTVPR